MMKKHIWILLIGVTVLSLLAVPGCKRSNVTDPDMIVNDSYQINLSGIADPSTLFVYQGCADQKSQITMSAIYNNGEPIAGKNIVLKIQDDVGYFPGDRKNIILHTNSSGKAFTTYTVTKFAREKIKAGLLTYIQAWIQTDLNPTYGIYDLIPIQLLSDLYEEVSNTFAHLITVNPDEDGTADENITLTAATGGTIQIYVYNSTGTDVIGFAISVIDPNSIITSPLGGTGATDSTQTIIVDNTGTAGDTASITYTAISPTDAVGQSFTINITLQ
jgi:hypothetical protein